MNCGQTQKEATEDHKVSSVLIKLGDEEHVTHRQVLESRTRIAATYSFAVIAL